MRTALFTVFALVPIGLSGCGPSAEHDAVCKDFIAASNERIAALAAKVKNIPAGSRKKLAEKYEAELAASWEEYGQHVRRFLENGLLSSELAGDPRSVDAFKYQAVQKERSRETGRASAALKCMEPGSPPCPRAGGPQA
jgi:hypothetical protein